MKKTTRYSLGVVIIVAMLAGFCILSAHSRAGRMAKTCNKLEINFTDTLRFISEEDVRSCIDKEYGAYMGQMLDSVGLHRIENALESRSSVEKCNAWTTDDGTLHVLVKERVPAVLFKKGDVKFYSDKNGYIFPLHGKEYGSVTAVSGALPLSEGASFTGEASEEKERRWISGVLGMMDFINSSRTFRGTLNTVNVRAGGEICLKFNGEEELFLLGQPEDFAAKFSRIEKYRNWIAPQKEDGYYKSVNVKYNKQIICRKDI